MGFILRDLGSDAAKERIMDFNMKYSVLMSVYKNEKANFFAQAVDSLLNQTVAPDQIVLVRDGEVYSELQETIDRYVNGYPDIFTYLPLDENGGLGKALRYGLEYCRNELVGRMDSDDISVPYRFERQLEFMSNNPDVDIVGGNISEFVSDPAVVADYRIVPQTNDEISAYLKKRNPFNHMTVMFKRSSVEKSGSYEDFYLFEDYYLWVRMYIAGVVFANIDEILVNVRIGDMSSRRGGMRYYRSCARLLKYMRKNHIIGFVDEVKQSTVRFCGYVLLPNKMREWAYKRFLRKNDKAE